MYFNGTKCQLFILSCLLSVSLFAKDVKTINTEGLQKPLCFVENKGQVYDENFHSLSDIQFKLSGKGLNLFVGNGKLLYQFRDTKLGADKPEITSYKMDVTLVGANPNAKFVPSDMLDYFEMYYLAQVGMDGVTAHTYRKVTYTDVYPNIDWVVYVSNGNVEYDFVVRPGGNPDDIKLKYGGATNLSITGEGNILATTPMGTVNEKHPVAYETGSHKSIDASFDLNDNVVSFKTADYEGSLTIDPFLQWNTYFGGTLEDVATCIKTDAAGEVYICGYTTSSGLAFNTTPISTPAGGYDAFLVKYSTAGAMSWATYYGGTGTDKATSCAVNSGGYVYITGNTTSAAGFSSGGGVYHTNNNGGGDMFLARFSKPLGTRNWGTYIGGPGLDQALAVCGDGANNDVYVVGSTASTSQITAAPSYQGSLIGSSDGYIGKFTSTSGAIMWATYYGGASTEELNGVVCDGAGNVYVAGRTSSASGLASGGAIQGTLNGTSNAFIARFASAGGVRNWGTYLGGTGTDTANCLAVDAQNNIYVTGSTTSADFPTTSLCYKSTLSGSEDAFLAKITSAGALTWSTYVGGNNFDDGASVCVDIMGNVAMTGTTLSTTGIASTGAYQTAIGGGYDAYITKFNTLGQRIYGTYFGKAGDDFGNSIIADSTLTNLMIAGSTSSSVGFSTAGAAQQVYGTGVSDGFVARFLRDTIVSFRLAYNDTLLCAGSSFVVHDTVNYNFGSGNTFIVQLSDATGSFGAPVNIGSVTSSTFGAIPCTIPAGTPAGSGYRIRIIANNPAFRSVDDFRNITIVNTFPFTPTASTPICVGYTLNLFSNASTYAINSYSWSGPSAYASAVANPTIPGVTLANAGTYSLTVTHTGCPPTTNSVNVVVNNVIPAAPIDSASSPICMGSDLYLFTKSVVSTGVHSYSWSGPAGFTSTSQNPVVFGVTPTEAGTYSAIDTMDGCASLPSTINITINPTDTPNITIHVNPNDTLCVGQLASFTTTVANGGFSPGYQWYTGAGVAVVGGVFDNYASAFFATGTPVYCILTPGLGCHDKPTDTSNVVVLTVLNNTPIVSITASDSNIVSGATVSLTGTAVGTLITGYQWYVNNVPVTGAIYDTVTLHNITHSDVVRLEVSSIALCANVGVSNTITIHVPSAVANVSPSFQAIELYPNPNNGSFSVKGLLQGINDGVADLQVSNALGQVVYSSTTAIQNGAIDKLVDLKNIPAGIYCLRISKDGLGKVFRFTKE